MRLTITIDCENAAFCESDGTRTPESAGAEVGCILRELRLRLRDGIDSGDTGHVVDSNGNKVGAWEVS